MGLSSDNRGYGLAVKAGAIVRLLARSRFDLSEETRTQRQIAEVLAGAGVTFEREKRLAPGDVVDFLTANGIAIEVKLRKGWSKMAIFRQLRRYATHEPVRCLMLVSNIAMGLPPEIAGKPTYFVSLGRGWL